MKPHIAPPPPFTDTHTLHEKEEGERAKWLLLSPWKVSSRNDEGYVHYGIETNYPDGQQVTIVPTISDLKILIALSIVETHNHWLETNQVRDD